MAQWYKVALVLAALLVVLAACSQLDREREAMLTFTRQALQIEAERDKVVILGASPFQRWQYKQRAPQLQAQLLLLKSPQTFQPVKDALMEVYRLETLAAQEDRVVASVNRFNADSPENRFIPKFPWVVAQKLRGDVYAQWAQLLRDHGIYPAKEGFTALVLERPATPTRAAPTPTPFPTPSSRSLQQWREIRPYLDSYLLQALQEVWEGGSLNTIEDYRLRQLYAVLPFGAPDFDTWVKQTLRQIQEENAAYEERSLP